MRMLPSLFTSVLPRLLSAILTRPFFAPACRAVALAKAEAHPVEVEVNCGWGDPMIVTLSCNLPTQ
jgi:hypothetical protein